MRLFFPFCVAKKEAIFKESKDERVLGIGNNAPLGFWVIRVNEGEHGFLKCVCLRSSYGVLDPTCSNLSTQTIHHRN